MTERPGTSSTDRATGVAPWTRVDTLSAAAVLVLAALFFMPNISARPLVGSVESKSALVARRMLRDGEPFVTSIDAAEVNKPPVYYWMVAGTSLLAGEVTEWTVRLPNVLACACAVMLTWVLARLLWGRTTAHVSAAVLATMVQFRWLAQSPRIDSVVTLCVTGALLCFRQALATGDSPRSRSSWCWSAAAWVVLAVGVGAKGPVAPAIALASVAAILALRRLAGEGRLRDDLARLHPLAGLLILAALVVPIYWMLDVASGGRFVRYFLLHENLARAGIVGEDVGGAFRNRHGLLYYPATIWLYAFPWSLFVPAAAAVAVSAARRGSRTRALFAPVAFAAPFLLLSLVAVKKWPYLMPLFPMLALVAGRYWAELLEGGLPRGWFARWATRVPAGMLMALAAALAALGVWLLAPGFFVWGHAPKELVTISKTGASGVGVALAASTAMAVASIAIFRGRFRIAFLVLTGWMALGLLYHNFVIERDGAWELSQRTFARDVNAWRTKHPSLAGEVVVCAGEPYELLFYLSGRPRVVRPNHAAAFLARVRPPDAPGDDETVVVIFDAKSFEKLSRTVGALPRVAATPDDPRVEEPLVLTLVKLVPADNPPR